MKQFINDKLYDTETASELCFHTSKTSYNRTTVTLYRTKKGSFFTYTYTIHDGGNVQANEIKLLSTTEAQEFYAKHDGDVGEWKAVFGEDVEKG